MLIADKRSLAIAEFANNWVTYLYRFAKYMLLASDEKPFPFTPLGKDVEPVNIDGDDFPTEKDHKEHKKKED